MNLELRFAEGVRVRVLITSLGSEGAYGLQAVNGFGNIAPRCTCYSFAAHLFSVPLRALGLKLYGFRAQIL